MKQGALLLLLLTVLGRTLAVQDAPMPPPARAHCRVFVVLARTRTRVLVLQNAYEQDGINVYDHFPLLPSIIEDVFDATLKDKYRSDEIYQILRPAFDQAVKWLLNRVDPSLCFAHFVMAESETTPDSTSQDKTVATRVIERLDWLRVRAKRDKHFPFALNMPSIKPQDDHESVISSGDLRVVPSTWRLYFYVVGTNYLSGKVAPSLSPGQVEVFGVMHVDAGGQVGKLSSESDSDAVEMIFDVRERWRRGKRQRQVNVALNMSDFYGREYPGFGRHATLQALIHPEEKHGALTSLEHPCFFKDHVLMVEGVNVTLKGTGDAVKCLTLLKSHVLSSNANCPPETFCFIGSAPQLQGGESFYASGVLREAVLRTHCVLKSIKDKRQESHVEPLLLPNPTLWSLRKAAITLCMLPYEDIVSGATLTHVSAAANVTLNSTVESSSSSLNILCFDLCYTIVLLEQLGVQDTDHRIYFVDRFEKEPVLSGRGSNDEVEHGNPAELVAWLTGAFLYLEALQRKVTFSIASELLAEQLSAGLPLGWNFSFLLLVAACLFLYLTTGRAGVKGQGSSTYHRVINGGPKAKYKDSTLSIMFVDDARE
ncbi:hypothetical protein CCR75_001566 [Bremia lactucae]|uniref:Uncharacterized protein n=1 Tax=Bremia lactucae TaxID=4779 RepID=A0A976FP82_BRELC|nr:hypothetical protein CCR75_001566 [Bremia lactucae]